MYMRVRFILDMPSWMTYIEHMVYAVCIIQVWILYSIPVSTRYSET